jgi:hypothetical protein
VTALAVCLPTLLGAAGCAAVDECGGASCAPAARSLSVPTDASLRYDPRGDYAGAFGTLGGRVDGRTACFWIDGSRNGSGPVTRYVLVLPAGYGALLEPTGRLDLLGPGGAPVAHVGRRVAVSVTPDPIDAPAGCPAGPALGALHLDLAHG